MKKITSLFLTAIILILSVFSVNASALTATESDAVPETALLSAKWLKEHGDEYTADATIEYFGTTIQQGKLYVKGDRSTTESPYKNTLTQKMIFTEYGVFRYYSEFPFFYIKTNTTNVREDIEYIFVDAYEEDGYYVEEFAAENDRTALMYFNNDELNKFIIWDYSLIIGIKYEYTITSYEVDDKDVSLPLLAVNITPIYNFLLLLGIIK